MLPSLKVPVAMNCCVEPTDISALIEGNEVIYSIILTKARNPLSREDIEGRFDRELSKN